MPNDKPRRLNEVVKVFVPQGANDVRWFLVEHQLEQAVMSARTVVSSLTNITLQPENEQERQLAEDCLSYMRAMLCGILRAKSSFLSYLSGTDVPERISRKEPWAYVKRD